MTSKYNKRFAGLVALVGSIGGLLFGYDLGVISGALPSLGIEFGLSIREKELVASIMLVGCVFGSIFGGSICDHIGRKKTIFMVCFLFIISGVILVWSMNLVMLCVGRFIVGIGVSISAIVDISYLTELSRLETRGALVSANELMITIGLLLAYVVDYTFMDKDDGWRWMFGFPVVLAVFWATLMVYMPESPRWLVVQGRFDEALLVLEMIYPSYEEARIEFHNSLDLIESMRSGGGGSSGGNSGGVVGLEDANGDDIFGGSSVHGGGGVSNAPNSYKNKSNSNSNSNRILTNDRLGLDQLETSIGTQQSSLQKQMQENRPNLNPHQPQRSLYSIIYEWRLSVFSSVVLMILQNFSGHAAVLTYAPEFFASAGYGRHAAAASTVILGVVKVVATIISLALVDKMGRKPILLIGIAGMTMSLSAVIVILNAGTVTEGALGTWLLVAVCVFVASYAIGFGPMTWLISSELFADEYRGRLIGISTIANWCGSLVVVSSFLSLAASIGIVQTLLYYVVMLILSFCFVMFFIPETKQKEILEITRDLSIMFNLSHVLRCGRGGVSNSSYYILDSTSAQPLSASSLLQSSSLISSSSSSSSSHTMQGSFSSTHPNHFSSNHSSSIGAVSTTSSSHSLSSSIKSPLSLIINESTKIPLEQKNE